MKANGVSVKHNAILIPPPPPYLSGGSSMTVWKRAELSAAGPSPTSMYSLGDSEVGVVLLVVVVAAAGELSWAWVRAWASSRVRSLVDGEETSRDLGLERVLLLPGRGRGC